MPGLPFPLWIHLADSDSPTLFPADCQAAADRLSWLLLLVIGGTLPLQRAGVAAPLATGRCLIASYPDAGLALRQGEDWRVVVFGFVGFDELCTWLVEQGGVYALPDQGWAARQLGSIAEQDKHLGLAQAMRLVAGVLANLVEHNYQPTRQPGNALIHAAVALMDTAVESDRSIASIAQELHITSQHLSYMFKEHLGTTPSRFLQERKMRRACQLLRQLELDVGGIASRLGYGSTAAFGAAFRSATGMSPTEYRNSHSVPLWSEHA
ncbi:MAG: helix-turn-helix transcriptional regulator [Planctomycetota bacterium]